MSLLFSTKNPAHIDRERMTFDLKKLEEELWIISGNIQVHYKLYRLLNVEEARDAPQFIPRVDRL